MGGNFQQPTATQAVFSVVSLVKVNDNSEYLTETHAVWLIPLRYARGDSLFSPCWFKLFAKLVDEVK
jgi:hypothetical protein